MAPSPYSVIVSFTASGTVSDYDDDAQQTLKNKLATAAGLNSTDGITLTITAASVIIEATIAVSSEGELTAVSDSLIAQLGSAQDASAILGISVQSVPSIAQSTSTVGATVITNTVSAQTAEDSGGSMMAIIIAAAAAAAIAVVALGAYLVCRRKKAANAKPVSIDAKPIDIKSTSATTNQVKTEVELHVPAVPATAVGPEDEEEYL